MAHACQQVGNNKKCPGERRGGVEQYMNTHEDQRYIGHRLIHRCSYLSLCFGVYFGLGRAL